MIQYPAVAVAIAIGAVPVDFALEMNPDEGKTLEHFLVMVVVESVPFPYGTPVGTGIGTTVAVLKITTALPEVETALI
jgi:hypothetical protein